MYVDKVPNRNSPPAYLVRESYREGGKVKKRTIANVSFLTPEQLIGFRALLKGATLTEDQPAFEDAFELLATTPHGHVAVVLGTYGHNRDKKRGKTQINYGLLTDREGRPISIDVYPGNTSDPNTVADQLQRVRRKFGIKKAIIAGDRGMLTSKQLDLAANDPQLVDYGWISALRSQQINKLVETNNLQLELFDQRDLAEIRSKAFPGERLIACRNPALARKRHHTRQDLLEATGIILETIAAATRREKSPYHGKAKIARRVEREGSRYRMLKHFKLHITETDFTYERDEQSIAHEARLDGLYIIRARNIGEEEMDAPAQAQRTSPVAPAQRSPATRKKEQSKKTSEGELPVQSFRTLIENLATLTRVTCRPKIKGAGNFLKYPQATALHQKAFSLLGLKPPGV